MSLFSPLLVIAQDKEQGDVLSKIASEIGFSDAHIITGGFVEATQALNLRTTSPEYIIIDVGDQLYDILPLIEEFAMHCEATVRVVVVGKTNDIEFYRELKQRGILEYFAYPLNAADIATTLVRSSKHNTIQNETSEQGTVISCMSAASGDGASTLALNLAYGLASEYQQSTVLVDMDYQFGLICKSLDLAAPFGIREVFDHPDRGIDALLVSKMMVKYHDNLSIIAAPAELKLLPVIRPEIVRDLINILRSRFRFVIIDVPHVWTDWTAATLTYSDHTMMVGQLWLRSLTHATRLLSAINAVGVDPKSIEMIINRSGAKFKEAITMEDYERICRRPIDACINNDVKAITHAENNAHTLFEGEQDTIVRQQISDIARKLVLRYVGKSAIKTVYRGHKKKGFLSFSKKQKGSI